MNLSKPSNQLKCFKFPPPKLIYIQIQLTQIDQNKQKKKIHLVMIYNIVLYIPYIFYWINKNFICIFTKNNILSLITEKKYKLT